MGNIDNSIEKYKKKTKTYTKIYENCIQIQRAIRQIQKNIEHYRKHIKQFSVYIYIMIETHKKTYTTLQKIVG